MALRDYAHARDVVEHTDSQDLQKQMSPSIERVLRMQAELDIAERKEALGGLPG
jgi:hypothetical protein